jgi:hypothetical protein
LQSKSTGSVSAAPQCATPEQDLDEADRSLRQANLLDARASLERAKGHLGNSAPTALQQRVAEQERIQKLLARLDTIRLGRATTVEGHFRRPESDHEYEQAFDNAGFAPFKLAVTVAAERIKRSPAPTALVAAIDDWALCAAQSEMRRAWLMAVARLVDPDPWRDRVRDPSKFWDGAHIKELAQSAPLQGQSLQLLIGVGDRLLHVDEAAAVPYLTRVQNRYPNDFYANFCLAYVLDLTNGHLVLPGRGGASTRYGRSPCALRPSSTGSGSRDRGASLSGTRRPTRPAGTQPSHGLGHHFGPTGSS